MRLVFFGLPREFDFFFISCILYTIHVEAFRDEIPEVLGLGCISECQSQTVTWSLLLFSMWVFFKYRINLSIVLVTEVYGNVFSKLWASHCKCDEQVYKLYLRLIRGFSLEVHYLNPCYRIFCGCHRFQLFCSQPSEMYLQSVSLCTHCTCSYS